MTVDKKSIREHAEKLLTDLGFTGDITVETNTAAEEAWDIKIESPDAASLIGFHGETLQAFQLILGFIINREAGEWQKITVNVGDYRERREEQLNHLAMSLADKVRTTGETQIIPNLTPSERRLVHVILGEDPEVCTESEGDGRNRVLTIKLRQPTA